MTALLEISDLCASFGGLHALAGASFNVERGKTTGLIGPNGAGKTTLFNAVTGLLPQATGRIVFDGVDIAGKRPERISRAGLIRTFQLARGCPRMTVFEHLMLYGPRQAGEGFLAGLVGGAAVKAREEELREKVWAMAHRLRLDQVLDNLVSALSGGQKKLLEIGRALLAEPEMILLDEPMAGVNPTLVGEIADQLEVVKAEGITILLIEHEMALIKRLCEEVIVMAEGKYLTHGSFDQVTADRRVQSSYLGRSRA
ncbi:amino acid/amide ABC transporter ATP-binding protein 1, HAAT family [Variovorax sp. CF079]|uniref:ABC transporter ATP-binding protein n=1 Tax=Variovorax sp. CF079 TaxID=1882774 RepID=UPI00088FE7D0|nr:ABC transporter ATP-binding protein [Variovorax sp. CF079]SDE93194.1 amino acid/amide ABC transporter ATP-binding protein 1, HAAT family [Variovorax sp. CF079]